MEFNRREFLLLATVVPAALQTPPSSAGPASAAIIEDLVAANHVLVQENVLDGFGHVSVRHDKNPNRFLISRSLAPELVTADDLIELDLDSNPVNARGRSLYQERFIHGEIYKARPDVNAIVHSHTPSVIPFGVSTTPLRPVYHMAGFIGSRVPVFDIRKSSGMTDMLVSDPAKGKALAQTLGKSTAVLMRGHGVAVVGASIPIAVGRSIYLDMDARILSQTLALGGGVTYLDPQEAQKIVEAGENGAYERPWQIWKRKAMGK
jgi:HCOMODA/2-hydroxy-3-carboxy-muconic semialdehyde decarboxylase